MHCDKWMCLSALLSFLARRLRVATPLFPYDEKPRGRSENFPRVVLHLQKKVAQTLVRKPAPGSCFNLVGLCGETDGAWTAESLWRGEYMQIQYLGDFWSSFALEWVWQNLEWPLWKRVSTQWWKEMKWTNTDDNSWKVGSVHMVCICVGSHKVSLSVCAQWFKSSQQGWLINGDSFRHFELKHNAAKRNTFGPVPAWQSPLCLVFVGLSSCHSFYTLHNLPCCFICQSKRDLVLKNKNMWLLLQRGMNNSIPCATTSKVPLAMGLNEGRLSCLPLLTWLPLINQRSQNWHLIFFTSPSHIHSHLHRF